MACEVAKTGAGVPHLREALVELSQTHTPQWRQEQEQIQDWSDDPRFRKDI